MVAKNTYMIRVIKKISIGALLFLLPWQTRYIWHYGDLRRGYWEYGSYSIYAVEIILWAVCAVFVFDAVRSGRVRDSMIVIKKQIVLGLFLLVAFASAITSSHHGVSWQSMVRVIEGILLCSVLVSYKNINALYALWGGAVLQGGLAVYQFLTQHVFASKWLGMAAQESYNGGASVIEFADQRWLRAYGSFGSPNALGIYLAMLFVLGLALYLNASEPRIKIMLSAGQLFILSGLLLSFSRGAWISVLTGLASVMVVLFFKQREFLRFAVKQILFALGVMVFWVSIFFPVFSARFNIENRLEAKSIVERKGQYAEAVSMVAMHPMLGVGPGAYTYAVYQKNNTWESWQYQPVHNVYMLISTEFGLVAMVLLLIFLFFIIQHAFQFNLVYVPVLVSLICAGLFDHWLASMFTGVVLWWTMLGVGYTTLVLDKK
jgi:hypothetical protein